LKNINSFHSSLFHRPTELVAHWRDVGHFRQQTIFPAPVERMSPLPVITRRQTGSSSKQVRPVLPHSSNTIITNYTKKVNTTTVSSQPANTFSAVKEEAGYGQQRQEGVDGDGEDDDGARPECEEEEE
jgi:hypothetical protein